MGVPTLREAIQFNDAPGLAAGWQVIDSLDDIWDFDEPLPKEIDLEFVEVVEDLLLAGKAVLAAQSAEGWWYFARPNPSLPPRRGPRGVYFVRDPAEGWRLNRLFRCFCGRTALTACLGYVTDALMQRQARTEVYCGYCGEVWSVPLVRSGGKSWLATGWAFS